MAGRGGVGLGQTPPLLPFLHGARGQVVPGRGVLEEARKVLPHAVGLRVVGAVGLRLRGQNLDRRQFEGVGRGGLGWRGERQLVVVVVVAVVVVVVQARLHVSGELHLGHREGHLVRAERGSGRHVVAPELEHPRRGADRAFVGELGSLGAHGAPHLPGLAAGGGQKGEGAGCSLWRGAGRPVLRGQIQAFDYYKLRMRLASTINVSEKKHVKNERHLQTLKSLSISTHETKSKPGVFLILKRSAPFQNPRPLRQSECQILQQTCKKVCKKLSVLCIASAAMGPRTPPRTCNPNCAERRRRAKCGRERGADAHIRLSGDSEERAGKSRVIQTPLSPGGGRLSVCRQSGRCVRRARVEGAARRAVNPGDGLRALGLHLVFIERKRSSQRGLQYDAGGEGEREDGTGGLVI